jgi:tRNA(Arg) A34 adenosine deaminase TadA
MKYNFMQYAIKEAQIALSKNEIPVGAIIVKNNSIIASSHNKTYTENDPTLHAEICVIRQSCTILSSPRLDDCDLYSTIEPCIMCASVISNARIRRVYYGASQSKYGAYESSGYIFSNIKHYHKPEIYSNISHDCCSKLMKQYFKLKR